MVDTESNEKLSGADTRTRVTIIDDDKPGQIGFEQVKGSIKATTDQDFAEIVLIRKNGSDGAVTVDYETFELDSTTMTATPWKDYEP